MQQSYHPIVLRVADGLADAIALALGLPLVLACWVAERVVRSSGR